MSEELYAERALVERVIEKRLPSGLKVLYVPFDREKVVAVYLCVKVGSKYEWDEVAGITHLIEHMIFKGGEGQKPGEVAGKVEEKGGYINAFTSYDQTCYYVVGPLEVLETALDVLSQAVFKPFFDPQELEKEKEVVVEEMKMRLDNPMIVLYEEMMKASYTRYPYKRPIIGYESSVRSVTRKDLFYFVDHFYTPENMLLIVTGAVSEKDLENLLEKYFSTLPERSLKRVSFPEEPYVSEPELRFVERPVKESYFAFTFPAPSIHEDTAPLMDLLAEILGGGESSRLYLKLKRKLNLVKTISASAFTPDGPGLFEIVGTADPQNFQKILEEVLKEIERFKREGPTKEELERAKTQVLSTFIYAQETAEGLSRQLASFHLSRGTYKDLLWYKDLIEKATPEEVRLTAEKWLNPQKLVSVFLTEKASFDKKVYLETIKKAVSEVEKPEIFVLENGLKVIFYPRRDIPTVGMALVFPGGLRFERKDNNGAFQALSLLWTRGTEKRSAEEIATILEGLSASIKGFSGRNTFGLKALSLSSKFHEVFDLFKEILLSPSFSPEEVEKARPELLSLLYQQEDQPFALSIKEFLEGIFPNHPYGLNQAGSKEFYLSFSSETLKNLYSQFVSPERGVLVITGDFDSETLKDKLKALAKEWKKGEKAFLEEAEPEIPKEKKRRVNKESFQTQILLGFQIPGLTSEERIPLEVLNSALSGQDGRLFRILRDERSLAYAVTSFMLLYPKKSVLIFYLACSPEKEKEAISGFFEILKEIKEKGLTENELQRAKNRLIGRLKLSLQSNLSKAEDMAVNEVLGLGWDYSERYATTLKKITSKEVKKVIEKYLDENKAFLLILGREEISGHNK